MDLGQTQRITDLTLIEIIRDEIKNQQCERRQSIRSGSQPLNWREFGIQYRTIEKGVMRRVVSMIIDALK